MDPDTLDAGVANAERAPAQAVRAESRAAAVRRGSLVDVSTLAWECGFVRGRPVLVTDEAYRTAGRGSGLPIGSVDDAVRIVEVRVAKVLLAGARRAGGTTQASAATFDAVGERFVIEVQAPGSEEPAVVIRLDDSGPEASRRTR